MVHFVLLLVQMTPTIASLQDNFKQPMNMIQKSRLYHPFSTGGAIVILVLTWYSQKGF